MAHEANAILAINSLDRYINYTNKTIVGYRPNPADPTGPPLPVYQTSNNQPVNNFLEAQFNRIG